jgi:MFS family permease
MCFVYLGILTVPFFIELWAQRNKIGISEDIRDGMGITNTDGPLTVYLVVIMNGSQLPGRLFGSTLCDYLRARKIHFVSCLVATAVILTFWLKATSYAAGCTFAALFGLILGIMVSLPINDTQDILGSHRTQLLGQYAGVVYTIASPFVLGGALIGGIIVDHFHTRAAGIWAASTFGVGAVLICLSFVLKDDTWKFDDPRERPLDEEEEVVVEFDKKVGGVEVKKEVV